MIEVSSCEMSRFKFGFVGAKTKAYNLALIAMEDSPSRFVDLCAGSNIVAYEVRRKFQIPVWTNDPDYHSVCLSKAFLQPNSMEKSGLVVIPQSGAGSRDPTISSFFHHEVINWIDGFAILHSENPLYLSALGTVLRVKATFRGAVFTANTAGLLLTIPILENSIQRFLKRKKDLIILGPPSHPTWGTARSFLDKTESGGTCYIDAPWPNKNGSPATYVTFTKRLNLILLQRPTPFEFYPLGKTGKSKKSEDVYSEILTWVRMAIGKFDRVLLATQSSNYPAFDDLNKILQQKFNIEEIYWQRVFGGHSSRMITEYLFSIKGE